MYWHDENQLRHDLVFKAMGVCEDEGLHVLCLVACVWLVHIYHHIFKKKISTHVLQGLFFDSYLQNIGAFEHFGL